MGRFGLISLSGDAPFAETVATVRAHQAVGIGLSSAIRTEFAHVDHASVLAAWRGGYLEIAQALRDVPEGAKVKRSGLPMGLASLCTARLRHVCDLGGCAPWLVVSQPRPFALARP